MNIGPRRLAAVLLSAALCVAAWMPSRAAAPAAPVTPAAATGVTVTYFSTDARCATCRKIERLTREVVEHRFAPEVRAGRLAFRVVNLDRPVNAHYVQDYQLVSKTVIVSTVANGREVRWENLQKVWLKHRDDADFQMYVADAVRRHLKNRA